MIATSDGENSATDKELSRAKSAGSGRVAVVGGGPGGLATALLLQSRGLDVTIFEKQNRIGGRTGQVRLGSPRGEFAFDLGPTFFLMPHVLGEIYRVCGRSLEAEVPMTRLDPMYRLVIGQRDERGEPTRDVVLDATQDTDEMARRIADVHGPDGARFHDFVRHNRAKLHAAEPILRRPMRGPLDLFNTDGIRALPHLHPLASVHRLSSRYFDHPAVRLAVGFQSKYLGMSPYDAPSLFTILPFIEYEYGVWHPEGGCHGLMRSMASVFRDMGGRVELGAEVEGIDFDRGPKPRVRGLQVRGETHACEHAVINADAAWAIKRLFPESMRGRPSDERVDRKRYSCSTYMLYLGVEGAVDLPHHTIRTSPHYEQNLDDISRAGGREGSITEDPSLYVCNASTTDPGLAPPGCSSLYVLVPVPNRKAPIDWISEGPMMRERVLDRMRDVLGVDVRGRIVCERAVTPDDWSRMNINHGATFSLAHSLDQMLFLRPQHRVPWADGAWFVGGGTHPGSGLPVIFLSSQITANLLLREAGLEPLPDHVPLPRITPFRPNREVAEDASRVESASLRGVERRSGDARPAAEVAPG